MDRPARKTKAVNYSEPKDFDDDDDFASVKAPPSKKAREDRKSLSKSSSQESNSTLSQKSRKALDVKLLERDLEAAITLSLLNNSDGIDGQSPLSKGEVEVQLPADENRDPTFLRSNCSVDLTVLGLDEITSEKESPAPPRQRTASKATEEPKRKFTDEDEDYEPKLTPDSESDEDFSEPAQSEDEEFTVKKVSKTKKKENVTKKEKTKAPPASKKEKQPSKPSKSKPAAAASIPVRSPHKAPRPAVSSSVPAPGPASSASPAGGRVPRWTPPAQVGKSPSSSSGPTVRSPAQGLRLGLSRRVRVKPLHPSVATH
ncbi:RAD51-associated protein 1 isoform X2 [Centropristis striata]|uniref:RAD51-associated protein 1 isoform X2 n=1 Tax=Centropristis striata TaxID=184440 RepID=UPI0027E1E14E|nr:RAD51-associated protein 1 isoform X2 [Centropristis striata]